MDRTSGNSGTLDVDILGAGKTQSRGLEVLSYNDTGAAGAKASGTVWRRWILVQMASMVQLVVLLLHILHLLVPPVQQFPRYLTSARSIACYIVPFSSSCAPNSCRL